MILVTTALNDISVYKILLSSDTDNLKMTKYWLINQPVLVCQTLLSQEWPIISRLTCLAIYQSITS